MSRRHLQESNSPVEIRKMRCSASCRSHRPYGPNFPVPLHHHTGNRCVSTQQFCCALNLKIRFMVHNCYLRLSTMAFIYCFTVGSESFNGLILDNHEDLSRFRAMAFRGGKRRSWAFLTSQKDL